MEKKSKEEILFNGEWLDLVKIEGSTFIRNKHMSVAILPYKTDDTGMIKEIGILEEYNPIRVNNKCETLITGTVEYEDDSLLFTAKRELLEEGGFEVKSEENDRWLFLGTIYPYKDNDRLVPIFACDVTRIEQVEAKGDGSEKEKKSKLVMKNVSEGIASDEGLVLAAFLRLFNYMYSKSMNNVQP
jgi:8-oxo-dGTP pyrophosphatase MutT (NUDIX family)